MQKEKTSLEEEKSVAVAEAENLRVSFDEMQTKEQDYQNKIDTLTSSNSWYEWRNQELQNSNDELIQENIRLKAASVQTMTLKPLDLEKLKLDSQTGEIVFYRMFQVDNYKTGEQYYVYGNIPYQLYYQYRSNSEGHTGAYVESADTQQYFETSLGTWKDMKFLADILRKEANYDDEVLANMVLQLTHQFYYQPTLNTKYPAETFVEGSGDRETLAVFAAALMKAGGLDTVVISGYAKGSPEDELGIGHAMVGVALDEQPNDHYRESSWYIDYSNNRYYLGETTWNNEMLTQQFDYDLLGTVVGDNPWSEFKIESTVGTPDP